MSSLISALGGDASVPAFYDVRSGVTATTTVSSWADARGPSGYGPALVQATGAKQPAWDSTNLLITGDGVDDFLDTGTSALFDMSGRGFSLVIVGNVQGASGKYAGTINSGGGTTRFLAAVSNGTSIAAEIGSGFATASSGVAVGATRRVTIVSKDSTTAGAIDVPNAVRGAGGGATAAAAGNNALTLFNAHSAFAGNGGNAVRAVLVIARQVSAGDVSTIATWAVTYHGAVLA